MAPEGNLDNSMIGWRARIGIIYPEDGLLDADFYRCAPEGVSVHVTRSFHQMTSDQLDLGMAAAMASSEDLESSAKTFMQIEADCIAYACTAASFSRGIGYDQELIGRLEEVSRTKATATATASVQALKALGAKRISVVAPYGKEVSEQLRKFLEETGFDVLSLEYLGCADLDIPKIDPGRIYRLAKSATRDHTDAIFISCTNFRAFEVVVPLENDIKKPVVTANQATMWHALTLAGVNQTQSHLGRLFNL